VLQAPLAPEKGSVRQGPEEQKLAEFKLRTSHKLSHLRCPEHGQSPRLRFTGASLRDVSIHMSGCCAKLIELANQKIAGP
jgi:hypothetical protein